MTPSPEQSRFIEAVTTTTDNLLVSACAGGAKTTSMTLAAKALGPGPRKVVALAFNKDAAESLAAKMPYWVECSTFHSFCYSALGTHLGKKPKPDGRRCVWFLKDLVPDWKQRRELEDDVLTLVSRVKTLPAGSASASEVADRFDIPCDSRMIELAEAVLARCCEQPFASVDFDDMLWLTHKLGCKFPHVDLVFLDEAQDTNPVQRALLQAILGEVGRLIAVGDGHQAIYAFRGADADAMPELRSAFAMRELELSVSYRCSQSVVLEAQKYL